MCGREVISVLWQLCAVFGGWKAPTGVWTPANGLACCTEHRHAHGEASEIYAAVSSVLTSKCEPCAHAKTFPRRSRNRWQPTWCFLVCVLGWKPPTQNSAVSPHPESSSPQQFESCLSRYWGRSCEQHTRDSHAQITCKIDIDEEVQKEIR